MATTLKRKDIQFHPSTDFLAEGGTAVVFRGSWLGARVAIKALKVHNTPFLRSPELLQDFQRESTLWVKLRHPNIVHLYGVVLPGDNGDDADLASRGPDGPAPTRFDKMPLMVMEFAEYGNLSSHLQLHGESIKYAEALRIASEIAKGMLYLHSQDVPICHGDLKPANVLIMADYTVKLTDFGFSKMRNNFSARNSSTAPNSKSVLGGTVRYMPPERLEGGKLSFHTDIYAFAMTLYEVFTRGKYPFELENLETEPMVIAAVLIRRLRPQRPADTVFCPAVVWELIRLCWDDNPADRPPFSEIVTVLSNTKLAEMVVVDEKTGADVLASEEFARPEFLSSVLGAALSSSKILERNLSGDDGKKSGASSVVGSAESTLGGSDKGPDPLPKGIFDGSSEPVKTGLLGRMSRRTLFIVLVTFFVLLVSTAIALGFVLANAPGTTPLPDPVVTVSQPFRVFRGHVSGVESAIVSVDGKRLFTTSSDSFARAWDIDTANSTRTFIGHRDLVNGVYVNRNMTLLWTGSHDDSVRMWDLRENRNLSAPTRRLTAHTTNVVGIGMSMDESFLFTASDDATVNMFNAFLPVNNSAQPFAPLRTFTGHNGELTGIAMSPDGKTFFTSSRDTTLRQFDIETAKTLKTFRGHSLRVNAVAVSPDGSHIFSGSSDNTVKMWNVETATNVRNFTGHSNWVTGLAVTPDGKTLLSSSFDRTARVWDIATGKTTRVVTGHSDTVNDVTVSPDGKWFFTTAEDYTAMMWAVQ